MSKTKTKTKKFASINDVYRRAEAGEVMAKLCIIGALSNCGCDHLAEGHSLGRRAAPMPRWKRFYQGVQEYISALVCEYGQSEVKAEKEFLAEINMARSYMEGREFEVEDPKLVQADIEGVTQDAVDLNGSHYFHHEGNWWLATRREGMPSSLCLKLKEGSPIARFLDRAIKTLNKELPNGIVKA